MRYRFYEELARLGRTRCYSITICFNAPATRFKEKLGAHVLELRLFVELLNRRRFYLPLRKWHEHMNSPSHVPVPPLRLD